MSHLRLILFASMVPVTILLIDDDDLSRDLLRLLLTREGYGIEATSSGEEALALLQAGTKTDVLLTDIQMPGITGEELARRVRSTQNPPRLLLAMSGSQPAEASIAGYDSFLLKPFTMEALAAAIEAAGRPTASDGTTAHEASMPAVLDLAIYDKLKSSMKTEKLHQLYELCLNDVTRRIAIMRIAGDEGDDEAYRREAHAIKGGCGLVGAAELQSIASSEENTGITANHVATLDEILAAAGRLKRMLVAQRNDT